MRWIPPDVLASWPTPNYVNPQTNPLVYVVYSFMAVFLALSTVAVTARLYARIRFRNWFSYDDFFLLLAYCAEIGVTTVLLLGYVRYGWARHIYDINPANLTPSAKIFFGLKIVWPVASCFTRISLIFFYYRILDHIQIRKYRWVLHFTMFIVWGILITFIFTTIFDCVPVSAYWIFPPVPNQSCINENVAFTLLSGLNTLSELIVALLPIPVVLQLKMDLRQRIGVISILSLGIFVSIVGAVRTYYVYKALETYDLTWYATPHTIAAVVEVDLGIIFACAPALRPLFRPGQSSASRTSRSSRQPSQTSTEKDDRLSSRSRVPTARSRNTESSPYLTEKPNIPPALRNDSAQSRITPPIRSRASPAIGSSSNLQGRRSTTTPVSNRSRYTTGQPRPSPPLYARRISHTPSDATSVSSEDEIANRKSLEIQISYQENGSDLRSLYVQPSRFLARAEEDRSLSNLSVSDDGRAARAHASWLAGKQLLGAQPLETRRPEYGSDSSSSDGGYDDKDLEKGVPSSEPRNTLQVPGAGDGEPESVSLSDFDFEPRSGSDGGGSTVSPVLSGEISPLPEFPTYRQNVSRQAPSENLLFVRHSLSTIASSNLLRPNPAATAAAVAAAAAAAAADGRSSINRSINTYDSRTRSGVFGSGTADIRNSDVPNISEVPRPATAPSAPEPDRAQPASKTRSSSEMVDWWGRYTSPAETAPPQEATMWGYAFDRVFGKNKRVSELGEQDSSNGTTNDSSLGLTTGAGSNGRTREQSPPVDNSQFVEGDRYRQSNVGTTSTQSTEGKNGGHRGQGGTWFDDAASI